MRYATFTFIFLASLALFTATPKAQGQGLCDYTADDNSTYDGTEPNGTSDFYLSVTIGDGRYDYGAYQVSPLSYGSYTDCDCNYQDGGLKSSNYESLSILEIDNDEQYCGYTLQWTFSGPSATLDPCTGGSCQSGSTLSSNYINYTTLRWFLYVDNF
jgi:hypothetical protein